MTWNRRIEKGDDQEEVEEQGVETEEYKEVEEWRLSKERKQGEGKNISF